MGSHPGSMLLPELPLCQQDETWRGKAAGNAEAPGTADIKGVTVNGVSSRVWQEDLIAAGCIRPTMLLPPLLGQMGCKGPS